MEKRLKIVESQVQNLRDIEEIKKLQRAYGYYFEHIMVDEIAELFADGLGVQFHLVGLGIFKGKAGVRKYFAAYRTGPERLDQIMQISGIVDVDPDGKTAKGRWYHYGALAIPLGKGVKQAFLSGLYENEYVKQKGKWKIKILKQCSVYSAPPNVGWVKPERVAAVDPKDVMKFAEPDIPEDVPHAYPSGYILPFHFKHPITGKKTSEDAE